MATCIMFLSLTGAGIALLLLSRPSLSSRSLVQDLLTEQASSSQGEVLPGVYSVGRGLWAKRLVGALMVLCLIALLTEMTPKKILLGVCIGGMAGEWWARQRGRRRAAIERRFSESNLPMVMERLVMAVGTGLDVIPALKEAAMDGRDPVSRAIRRIVRLAEGGLSVEDSIKTVSDEACSPAAKHAFMHIRLAYQQGGEVVRPLRELSDATQTAYQEGIEEEIAKLPVKAVVPLLLTFAGLIVCFLTVPLIQVGSIAQKVTHVGP